MATPINWRLENGAWHSGRLGRQLLCAVHRHHAPCNQTLRSYIQYAHTVEQNSLVQEGCLSGMALHFEVAYSCM